jgi:hypothetical protein
LTLYQHDDGIGSASGLDGAGVGFGNAGGTSTNTCDEVSLTVLLPQPFHLDPIPVSGLGNHILESYVSTLQREIKKGSAAFHGGVFGAITKANLLLSRRGRRATVFGMPYWKAYFDID